METWGGDSGGDVSEGAMAGGEDGVELIDG